MTPRNWRAPLLALMATCVFAAPALAGKEDRAKAAIAQAQAKVDLAVKAGVAENAGDIQARAQDALTRATKEISDDDEDRALNAADEAAALAELAMVTSEAKKLEAERDTLRAGQ